MFEQTATQGQINKADIKTKKQNETTEQFQD